MTEDIDTVFSNPLTGEVTTKLPEIEPDEVPGSQNLPDDVKNSEVPPESQDVPGVEPVVEDD